MWKGKKKRAIVAADSVGVKEELFLSAGVALVGEGGGGGRDHQVIG